MTFRDSNAKEIFFIVKLLTLFLGNGHTCLQMNHSYLPTNTHSSLNQLNKRFNLTSTVISLHTGYADQLNNKQ